MFFRRSATAVPGALGEAEGAHQARRAARPMIGLSEPPTRCRTGLAATVMQRNAHLRRRRNGREQDKADQGERQELPRRD